MAKQASAQGARDTPVYRSEAGRAAVMESYQRKLQSLAFAHESRMLETQFGQTHVLALGQPLNPPLLALHGVNFGAPFMADFVGPLAHKFRIYIPDIVGQPGRSAPVQPDPSSGHNYARWVVNVLDGLGIDAAPVIGISFGGAVALDLAAYAPQRISKAALIVPGGFQGSGSYVSLLFRLFLPWQLYRFFPDRSRVAGVVRPLAWEMDEAYYDHFDAILRHAHWLIPPPGPFSREHLKDFHAPTAVYAARQDIFFPGDEIIPEARMVIPNLADAAVFESSHFPTKAMQTEVTRRISSFLG